MNLDEITELIKATSDGPWKFCKDEDGRPLVCIGAENEHGGPIACSDPEGIVCLTDGDAKWIAKSREVAFWMLQQMQSARSEAIAALELAAKLEAEVERLRAAPPTHGDGVYQNQCCDCQGMFLGPKRAVVCPDCRNAQQPARVRMDPQPAIYSRRRMVPNTAGVVLKLGGGWAKVSPRPQFDPVRDPDGTWYWELRPAAQGEEGKP